MARDRLTSSSSRPATAPSVTGAATESTARQAVSGLDSRVRASLHRVPRRVRPGVLLFMLLATAVLYVVPRTLDIDRVVTVDEPVFLSITANFFNAIAHADFANTSQFLYPAVTIMWAGMLGFLAELPTYVTVHPAQLESLKSVHEPIWAAGSDPLTVLVTTRVAKIIVQAGFFLLTLWLISRLFGLAVTALTAAFIVFDPFLIAHDQLLHVDGVTGITAFASMLTVAYADRRQTRTALWVLAGILAALCWLTRLTGLVLLPIVLLVIADGAISRYRQGAQTGSVALISAAKSAGWVIGAGVVTTIALWPALWVDPDGAIRSTLDEWRHSIETPHPWGLFFAGETITGDPGILFYVYVFLYKITPYTLVGLALVAVALLFRIDSLIPRRDWRPVVILTAFVAVYSLGMATGTRKFDRYILPDFLFFDLLAAIGVIGVVSLLWTRRNTALQVGGVIAVGLLVFGQVSLALAQRPYPLVYYNPLLGGTQTAEEVLMVGWGEGLDQAAAFILSQPGGDSAVVRTSIHRTTMLYFFPETVITGSLLLGANERSLIAWANTDYAVTHLLQWNRTTFDGVVPYLAEFEPVYTVMIDGIEFVRVYDLRHIPPPDWMIERSGCNWRFDDKLTLVAYGPRPRGDRQALTENEHAIELIFQTNGATGLASEYQLRGTLQPKGPSFPLGSRATASRSFTTSLEPNPRTELLATATQTVLLPEGRTLGDYWLQVAMIDPAMNQALPVVNLENGLVNERAGQPAC